MSYTAMTFLGGTVMDIIKIRNADYDRYEELLMQRDQLRKEADIYHGLYVREFGDLHLQIFEKQIACIRKKKLIGYYQLAMNRGDAINQATIDALINDEMENYRRQLQGMIEELGQKQRNRQLDRLHLQSRQGCQYRCAAQFLQL